MSDVNLTQLSLKVVINNMSSIDKAMMIESMAEDRTLKYVMAYLGKPSSSKWAGHFCELHWRFIDHRREWIKIHKCISLGSHDITFMVKTQGGRLIVIKIDKIGLYIANTVPDIWVPYIWEEIYNFKDEWTATSSIESPVKRIHQRSVIFFKIIDIINSLISG